MMNDKVFQKILDEISPYFYEDWEQVVFYCEYGVTTYSMSFYLKVGKDYIKCYDMDGITDDQLYKSFKKIDNFISKEQKEEQWTNMTMVVSSDGKMKTEFDYTDLSTSAYQYKRDWKKKYLK